MTVRDLIAMSIDTGVSDDVCEELYIAFCGPLELTPEGEDHFAEVLGYEVDLWSGGCTVRVEDENGKYRKRLNRAVEFFHAAAGFCRESDYHKWFREG